MDASNLQLSFHCKLLLLLFFISDLGINIFAHLFQKCKDSLDLILGILHSALCLIDVIQNCPVCKEAIKEEIRKFQKAVYCNLKVCGDLNIGIKSRNRIGKMKLNIASNHPKNIYSSKISSSRFFTSSRKDSSPMVLILKKTA